MYQNQFEFSVRVNGRPVTEFRDDKSAIWIEGRKKSNYKLVFKNNTASRVKAVFSVDGLNVLTGDATWSDGYAVNAWSEIEVPGWRKDKDGVAEFYFSSQERSYSERTGKGTANVGVIGAKVYSERYQPTYVWNHPVWPYTYPSGTLTGSPSPFIGGVFGSATSSVNVSASAMNSMQNSMQFTASGATPESVSPSTKKTFRVGAKEVKTSGGLDAVEQSLGTGWGDHKEFKTTNVYFDTHSFASATFEIFYDDRRGLEDRGIYVKNKERSRPQAFPNDHGCPFPCK